MTDLVCRLCDAETTYADASIADSEASCPESDDGKHEWDEVGGGPEFPFRIDSETEVHEDPVAGRYGERVSIVEYECPECGYDRAKEAHLILPGVYSIRCMACEHVHEQG